MNIKNGPDAVNTNVVTDALAALPAPSTTAEPYAAYLVCTIPWWTPPPATRFGRGARRAWNLAKNGVDAAAGCKFFGRPIAPLAADWPLAPLAVLLTGYGQYARQYWWLELPVTGLVILTDEYVRALVEATIQLVRLVEVSIQ